MYHLNNKDIDIRILNNNYNNNKTTININKQIK